MALSRGGIRCARFWTWICLLGWSSRRIMIRGIMEEDGGYEEVGCGEGVGEVDAVGRGGWCGWNGGLVGVKVRVGNL